MGDGYQLPEGDAFTDETVCVKVYVPNKPEYRRALLGSLTYLGTWTAWERDAAKRGRDAARAWKAATDETLNAWGEGCEADCPDCPPYCFETIEELEEWLAETDEMSITINNCCCCGGCGCSSQTAPDNTPPDDYTPPYDDSDITPPDGGSPEFLAAKCDALHYYLYATRLAMLQWADRLGSIDDVQSWWEDLFGFLSATINDFAYAAYLNLIALSGGYTSPVDMIATLYDQHYNQMLCLLYQSTNAASAKDAWLTYLSGEVFSTLPVSVRTPLLHIVSYVPLDPVYTDPESLNVPATHRGRDCSACSLDDELPEAPDGYKFVWPSYVIEQSSDPSTTSFVAGAATAAYSAYLDGSDVAWSPTVRFGAYDPQAGESIEGQAWWILENQASGGDDPAGNICRIAGKSEPAIYAWLKLDDGNDPADFSGMFDDVNYTNYSPGTLEYSEDGFYRRAGVSSSGGPVESAKLRYAWLVKVT